MTRMEARNLHLQFTINITLERLTGYLKILYLFMFMFKTFHFFILVLEFDGKLK